MPLDLTNYDDLNFGDTIDTVVLDPETPYLYVVNGNTVPASTWSPYGIAAHHSADVTQTHWYGLSYEVGLNLSAQAQVDGDEAAAPFPVSIQWIARLRQSDAVDAPILFEQQVNIEVTLNSFSKVGSNHVIDGYSYDETISTTVVDGVAIDPSDAVNYLDNDNTTESEGDTGEIEQLDPFNSRWLKIFRSAPYMMEWGAGNKWETEFTVTPAIDDASIGIWNWGSEGVILYRGIHSFTAGVLSNAGLVWPAAHLHGTSVDPAPEFGSFIDPAGNLFTAVNEGDSVQVRKFPNGSSSGALLHLQADAKNASLYQAASGAMVMGYTQRSTGDYRTIQSTDYGRTFA